MFCTNQPFPLLLVRLVVEAEVTEMPALPSGVPKRTLQATEASLHMALINITLGSR